jgi:sulfoxide reductase heme-binding subunit YedZ
VRLVWLGINDHLSANPIEFIERSTGFWALFILLATLTLTPIRLLTGRAWQIQLRRMLGLFMFFYGCLHIVTYVWLDFAFDWVGITKDIAKHPRILVGFSAFILSVPLAITSTNSMMKRLRERWKQLHQLVYLIAILAIVHFWWLVKKDIREPLLYALILAVLLGIRLFFNYSKSLKSSHLSRIS